MLSADPGVMVASTEIAAILETMSDGFQAFDREWRYTYVNTVTERRLGRKREELLGQVCWEACPDSVGTPFWSASIQAMESGELIVFEEFCPHDQSWVEYSLHPSAHGLVAYTRDITARKKAEEALRRSEALLTDFFENATVGLHWVGGDGKILRANRAEMELLGYGPEEYIGHHIAEFHADRPVIKDILRRLAAGEELHSYEARLRCKDGSLRHVLISSNVLFQEGQFVHTRCFTRDITDRKKAERALREAEARQQAFMRDVLASVTDHKLRLVEDPDELPPCHTQVAGPIPISQTDLRALRHAVCDATAALGFSDERAFDLVTAAGEAAMNAAVHGGGGDGRVCIGPEKTVQVWIEDRGHGIAMEQLPRATLEKGHSTAGGLGHGFWLMLQTADRLWLLTGTNGTTVVLEQDQTVPAPAWLT